MPLFDLVSGSIAGVLELTLILRARQGKCLSLFPLFYSYVFYLLIGTSTTLAILWRHPASYSSVFWYHFMITLVVEFAVLVEISDHIFNPYPAVRHLGRLLAICISAIFLFYIVPSLTGHESSSSTILDFVKRTAVTKTAIIITLLAAARYYRLPLGKNVGGLMIGFCAYLAINVANFACAEKYGRALYGDIFGVVGPLSCHVALLIWTVALWRYEPVLRVGPVLSEDGRGPSASVSYQLGQFDAKLERVLRK